MITLNNLADYLTTMVKAQESFGQPNSFEAFVQKHGVRFESPKDDKLPKGGRRGRMKECYANAARLVLETDYTYCEGYALRKGLIPVLHAWACDDNGNVIEVTWDDPQNAEYFGIKFSRKFLMNQLCKNKVFGLIDQPPFELLRGKVKGFNANAA